MQWGLHSIMHTYWGTSLLMTCYTASMCKSLWFVVKGHAPPPPPPPPFSLDFYQGRQALNFCLREDKIHTSGGTRQSEV